MFREGLHSKAVRAIRDDIEEHVRRLFADLNAPTTEAHSPAHAPTDRHQVDEAHNFASPSPHGPATGPSPVPSCWQKGDPIIAASDIDSSQRREVAAALRRGRDVRRGPDGRRTAHTLRMLAHMLDSD